MSALTKAAVDKVAEITHQNPKDIRKLLESGWTFFWDVNGYRWEKTTDDMNKIGPLLP